MEGDFEQRCERGPVRGVDVGQGTFRRDTFVLDAQHLQVGVDQGDGHRFDAVVHMNGGRVLVHGRSGDPELGGGGPLHIGQVAHRGAGQHVEIIRQHKVEKITSRPTFHRDVQLGVGGKQG